MKPHIITIVVGALFTLTTGVCCAQTAGADVANPAPFGRPVDDQRIFVHGLLDQLEDRMGSGQHELRWEAQGWAGTDSDRLWLKSEGFFIPGGQVKDGIHEALYDRPVTSYFDLQAGIRYDADSDPSRAWAAFGIQGLAPQWFNLEATIYGSDGGHLAARLRTFYELLLTQRLILQPEIELDAYSKAEAERGVGAGISDFDAGLRLRYEITRKVAPYIGVDYRDLFGATAGSARQRGETTSDFTFVAGIRSWF